MSFIKANNTITTTKTENTILFHAIQMHLNDAELEDLNAMLLQFVEICSSHRYNPTLILAIQSIQSELKETN